MTAPATPAPSTTTAATRRLRAAYGLALLVNLVVVVERWRAAAGARFAGHADTSFYFQYARNVARGRGQTVDFVWHFLDAPAHVHHYAPDYWQPLPSLLMSLPMRLLGDDRLRVALLAPMVAAALVPFAAAWLARTLRTARWVPPATLAVVPLVRGLNLFSVQAESVPFYVLAVLATFALAATRTDRTLRWFFVGVTAALAYLCRNDGLLLCLVVGLLLLARLARNRERAQWLAVGAYAAGAALVLLPWVATNLANLGRPVPSTTKLMFLTSFEHLYSVHHQDTLASLWHAGLATNVHLRTKALWLQLDTLVRTVQPVAFQLAVVLVVVRIVRRTPRSDGGSPWLLPCVAAAAVFLFDVLLTPVASGPGAWQRSVNAFVPVLLIAALDGLARLPVHRLFRAVVVVALATQPALSVAGDVRFAVAFDNSVGDKLIGLRDLVRPDGRPPVVMTRDPWEVSEVTGYPSVQIPTDDVCTVLAVARQYGVTYLLRSGVRPLLRTPAQLSAAGFVEVGELHDPTRVVYRLDHPAC